MPLSVWTAHLWVTSHLPVDTARFLMWVHRSIIIRFFKSSISCQMRKERLTKERRYEPRILYPANELLSIKGTNSYVHGELRKLYSHEAFLRNLLDGELDIKMTRETLTCLVVSTKQSVTCKAEIECMLRGNKYIYSLCTI